MPRMMAFARTERAFVAGLQTVTRRRDWGHVKEGQILTAVTRVNGCDTGEYPKILGYIRILEMVREPLDTILTTPYEKLAAEGIQFNDPEDILKFYIQVFRVPRKTVYTKITFEHIAFSD